MRCFWILLILISCQNSKNMSSDYFSKLTPEEKRVIVDKGTEAPFTGEYDDFFEHGVFICRACSSPLYESKDKFDAGCGWPAFDKVKDGSVERIKDMSLGYERTEIICAKCKGHLGHVFEGEKLTPENTRHCVNSISIRFLSYDSLSLATFAAGCFWGVEELFRTIQGVYSTTVGYVGGEKVDPTYKEVCTGNTGHAEAVQIVYDAKQVNFITLLNIFWNNHDPTTLNRQGPDVGSQYRSAIFFHHEDQKKAAENSKKELDRSNKFKKRIVTQIIPITNFYRAEEHHQDYLYKRGLGSCHL